MITRNTLRFAVATIAVVLLGSGLAPSANADDPCAECPKSPGYWKNHPYEWPVSNITLGTTRYSKHEARDILELEWPGVDHHDTMLKLARQLIAAKLNMYSGVDASMVATEMDEGDAMLALHPFGDAISNAERAEARNMIVILNDFNNGDLTTLAVELTEFEGRTDARDVVLTWTTTSEVDNAGFEIQILRPFADAFETVAFTPGSGTRLGEITYAERIADVDFGTNRFRLKQLDADGAFKYSQTIEVTIEPDTPFVLGAAYPNPVQTSAMISVSLSDADEADLAVFDLLGRRVKTVFAGSLTAGSHELVLDVSDLPGGIYLYRLSTGALTDTGTLSVIR